MIINNKDNTFCVVDNITGEILPLGKGGKIIALSENEIKEQTRTKQEKAKQEAIRENLSQSHWIASYSEEMKLLSKEIDVIEAGACFRLCLQMNMTSRGRIDINGRPMKRKELHELFGVKKTQGDEILRNLLKASVAFLVKGKRQNKCYTYYINERFHTMGIKIQSNVKFSKIMKMQTKILLERIELKHMGMLYKLLPYVQYQSMYICENAEEDLRLNPEDDWDSNYSNGTYKEIKHFNQKVLAEKIGVSYKTIGRWLKELQNAGIIQYDVGAQGLYMIRVRPDIISKHNSKKIMPGTYLTALLSDFATLDKAYFNYLKSEKQDRNNLVNNQEDFNAMIA